MNKLQKFIKNVPWAIENLIRFVFFRSIFYFRKYLTNNGIKLEKQEHLMSFLENIKYF